MANSKVPVAKAISLSSMDGEEFYVVITQEERSKRWSYVNKKHSLK